MECPNCKNPLNAKSRFCSKCGTKITTSPQSCPHCGKQQRSIARFCSSCGKDLQTKPGGVACIHCGTPAPENARICIHCGQPVSGNPCPQCKRANRPQSAYCAHCGSLLIGSKLDHPYETGRLPARVLLKERYYIVKRIAQGGMGAIYLAADTKKPGLRWAIKEMSYAMLDTLSASKRDEIRANLEESFKREFEILHQSSHPNLPLAEDYFEEMGRPYIVMEYIEGQNLEKILEQVKPGTFLSENQVLQWASQLCDVLHYLHSQEPPIIYRDLKPSNVMEDAQTKQLKLIDFGIARFYKPGKKGDTARFGTEGYLAPEILSSIDQTNPATDLYSLGALMHQLLTNREPSLTPFVFPPVRSINPAISLEVEKAIAHAVEPNPTRRPQTALVMKQEFLGGKLAFSAPSGKNSKKVGTGVQAPVHAAIHTGTISVRPEKIALGKISINKMNKPATLFVQAPKNTEMSLAVLDNWLQPRPEKLITSNQPEMIQLVLLADKIHRPGWEPAKGSWIDQLPTFIKAYFGLHFQLVPVKKRYQSMLIISTFGQDNTEVPVSAEIEPAGILVVLGWILAFGIILLEALVLCSPLILLLLLLLGDV